MLTWLVLVVAIGGLFATHHGEPSLSAWKDSWLLNFENDAVHRGLDKWVPCGETASNCTFILPAYVPVRAHSDYAQLIPKVIFQTWKSYTAAGPNHHEAVGSFIRHNPDYEYYLFDDEAASSFMWRFYRDHAELYDRILPGAMRADIWRLAVIYRYGGVYVDSDAQSVTPLRTFIWPNASVVTGIGSIGNDFHRWALQYTPRHPIIFTALKTVLLRVKQLYQGQKRGKVTQTTGPMAFQDAVMDALKLAQCPLKIPSATSAAPKSSSLPISSRTITTTASAGSAATTTTATVVSTAHRYQRTAPGSSASVPYLVALARTSPSLRGSTDHQHSSTRSTYNTQPSPFLHYLPQHYCNDRVGVLQIFATDYLGGNIIFKVSGVENEKNNVSVHYQVAQKSYHTLFKTERGKS